MRALAFFKTQTPIDQTQPRIGYHVDTQRRRQVRTIHVQQQQL
jgi:hypothetical protein